MSYVSSVSRRIWGDKNVHVSENSLWLLTCFWLICTSSLLHDIYSLRLFWVETKLWRRRFVYVVKIVSVIYIFGLICRGLLLHDQLPFLSCVQCESRQSCKEKGMYMSPNPLLWFTFFVLIHSGLLLQYECLFITSVRFWSRHIWRE